MAATYRVEARHAGPSNRVVFTVQCRGDEESPGWPMWEDYSTHTDRGTARMRCDELVALRGGLRGADVSTVAGYDLVPHRPTS